MEKITQAFPPGIEVINTVSGKVGVVLPSHHNEKSPRLVGNDSIAIRTRIVSGKNKGKWSYKHWAIQNLTLEDNSKKLAVAGK